MLDYLSISTNHEAMLEYGGKVYLFYHDNLLPGGGDFRRALAADEMHFTPDGKIEEVKETREGLTPIQLPAANP